MPVAPPPTCPPPHSYVQGPPPAQIEPKHMPPPPLAQRRPRSLVQGPPVQVGEEAQVLAMLLHKLQVLVADLRIRGIRVRGRGQGHILQCRGSRHLRRGRGGGGSLPMHPAWIALAARRQCQPWWPMRCAARTDTMFCSLQPCTAASSSAPCAVWTSWLGGRRQAVCLCAWAPLQRSNLTPHEC